VDTLNGRRDVLERFLTATAKGWEFAYHNQEKAVDLLVKEFPNLKREDELEAVGTMLRYAFNDNTRKFGWGAMDPAVWQEQIDLHAELKQFSKRVPKAEEVMTLDILKATDAARPKLG
jgi:NitT/TauT family transport system substrate-binding protein